MIVIPQQGRAILHVYRGDSAVWTFPASSLPTLELADADIRFTAKASVDDVDAAVEWVRRYDMLGYRATAGPLAPELNALLEAVERWEASHDD